MFQQTVNWLSCLASKIKAGRVNDRRHKEWLYYVIWDWVYMLEVEVKTQLLTNDTNRVGTTECIADVYKFICLFQSRCLSMTTNKTAGNTEIYQWLKIKTHFHNLTICKKPRCSLYNNTGNHLKISVLSADSKSNLASTGSSIKDETFNLCQTINPKWKGCKFLD